MLILSRRPGEELQIGALVKVQILSIRGNQVRIAIHAPKSVKIMRCELEPRPGDPVFDPSKWPA